MSERDWAQESVTVYEEGKTRGPEEALTEPVRSDRPLNALPIGDRAFLHVVYGLDPTWEDVQYIANATGQSHRAVLEQIRAAYRTNARRRVDHTKLMEKVANAYSRLIELAEKEQTLEEERRALSYQRPVDEKQVKAVTSRLQQVKNRIMRLRALQEQWQEESLKVLRIPSKEVAQIFLTTAAAVDKKLSRLKPQLRALANKREQGNE